MRTLLVGYDLHRPRQEYQPLIDALKEMPGWWHHLDSTWLIRTDLTAVALRDRLRSFLDSNDELLVIDVTARPTAWTGLTQRAGDWIKKHL